MNNGLPDILNQFALPPQAVEDIKRMGVVPRTLQANNTGVVTEFNFAGHDKGVAFRFWIHAQKNQLQSEIADMEINDDVEMIQWFCKKKHRPVERVHMLPEELLKFKKKEVITYPEELRGKPFRQRTTVFPLVCIGGKYAEEYKRWKKGLGSEGLELSRWNKLSLGEVKSLQSIGIFTVQQFASMDEERVLDATFPKSLREKFYAAIHYVNSQEPLEGLKQATSELVSLKKDHDDQAKTIDELRAEIDALKAAQEKPAKRGAKAKAAVKAKAKPAPKAKKGKPGRKPKYDPPQFDEGDDYEDGDDE